MLKISSRSNFNLFGTPKAHRYSKLESGHDYCPNALTLLVTSVESRMLLVTNTVSPSGSSKHLPAVMLAVETFTSPKEYEHELGILISPSEYVSDDVCSWNYNNNISNLFCNENKNLFTFYGNIKSHGLR